jgi:hypothetical protein
MRTQSGRTIRRLFAALALLFGLAAAALVLPSAATAAEVPPPKTPVATSITMVRTGGITGVPAKFFVDASNGPEGIRLLHLTSTPEFLALDPFYGPKNPCCDFFVYHLLVRYDSGDTKTVVTSDAAEDVPEILTKVIRLTEFIGATDAS